jgi:DUF1365 family protein
MPRCHNFSYRLFYVYLDLEESASVFDRFIFWSVNRKNIAWFSEDDHLKSYFDRHNLSDRSLTNRVRAFIKKQTGITTTGPIRLLTHFSYFGFRFNPVSFYYCYHEDGTTLQYIIAEVNNTPWQEQHCYIIPADDSGNSTHIKHQENKAFHVSPFMPMNMQYRFSFNHPAETLNVHMENYKQDEKVFDATLTLARKEITGKNLASALLRFPFITIKVLAAIYYQAIILFIKRMPVFDHPGNKTTESVKS